MSKDYGSWSLADIKTELKKRKARVTGKKAVLVQRLHDYDKLFGPLVNDSESVYKINVPSPDNFRDITSDSTMPIFNDEDLQLFCQLAEREDVTTSYNMYNEKFLISCRSAYVNNDFYITSLCASEMRKNIVYNTTIKAKNNLILEAQCECAAGAGPYGQCKHILATMYGLIDFTKTKKIQLKESCTSTLQTFHRPRQMYSGNPIEAQNLTLKFKHNKMKTIPTFDPRPSVESDEKYEENFKSLIANYCGHFGGNMPIAQIVMPADKSILHKDHDYLEKTAEQLYLESLILPNNQLLDLEFKTRNNKKEWSKERKFRLQSSDFGKICKQKKNELNLARSLLKNKDLQTPPIKHGKKYEPQAIKKFEELTGMTTKKCGIIVHPDPDFQFLGCTPDAIINDNEVLEVKCPYTARNKKISSETVPYLYFCENSGHFKLDETHDYFYQIQGQLFCTQKEIANFFIYTICDSYHIKIHRDESFIKIMLDKLKSFYNDYYKKVLLDRFLYNKRF